MVTKTASKKNVEKARSAKEPKEADERSLVRRFVTALPGYVLRRVTAATKSVVERGAGYLFGQDASKNVEPRGKIQRMPQPRRDTFGRAPRDEENEVEEGEELDIVVDLEPSAYDVGTIAPPTDGSPEESGQLPPEPIQERRGAESDAVSFEQRRRGGPLTGQAPPKAHGPRHTGGGQRVGRASDEETEIDELYELPIEDYDQLALADIEERASDLDQVEIRILLDYERKNKCRQGVIDVLSDRLAA